MKIRVERCEDTVVVKVEEQISPRDFQILMAGLPKLATGVKVLVISFEDAQYPETMLPLLLQIKNSLLKIPNLMMGIVSPIEGFGDIPTFSMAMSQIPGGFGKLITAKFDVEEIKRDLTQQVQAAEEKLKSFEGQKISMSELKAEKAALELQRDVLDASVKVLIQRLTAQKKPVFTEEEKKTLPSPANLQKSFNDVYTLMKQKGLS